MMSSGRIPDDRGSLSAGSFRHTPLQIIHIFGNLMRVWSVYSMYRFLSGTNASVVLFIFSCLLASSIIFLTLQKPWKGRPLSNEQVVPSVVNGGITAFYFILWSKGLMWNGPLKALVAEYSGASLGVLSAVLYGWTHRSHVWKKVSGLVAMLAAFYFLSQGWAMETNSPFFFKNSITDSDGHVEEGSGMKEMSVSIVAGILSALRRVISRRVSLKNQLKRRLHAVTIASATCFIFPIAMWDLIIDLDSDENHIPYLHMWPYLSTVLFGIVFIFYIDNIAEERLHMVFCSPKHVLVTGGCVTAMEIMYKMDFSLPGFIVCISILAFGVHAATALGHSNAGSKHKADESSDFRGPDTQHSLPT